MLLLIIISIASSCKTRADYHQQTFMPSYLDNVLSKNIAFSVGIDHMGNKWVGSQKGIYKFDGKKWYTYFTK